jgi:hypothetical protein
VTSLKTTQLGQTGLDIPRVGFLHPDHVDPIVVAANGEITYQDIAEIEGSTR